VLHADPDSHQFAVADAQKATRRAEDGA